MLVDRYTNLEWYYFMESDPKTISNIIVEVCRAIPVLLVKDGSLGILLEDQFICTLCNQSFLNKNASSADESSAKVLFKHPSTTFVYTKT